MTAEARGQALVEMALVLPLILFVCLGFTEMGFLIVSKADQDRATQVVADWAAERPGDSSWNSVANDQLPGCDVTLDDSGRPGVVTASSTCTYVPVATRGLWDGLAVSSEESAVVRDSASPAPTPGPAPS